MFQQSLTVLTPDQIRQQAPSVFATKPRGDVSSRYNFLPSTEVLEALGTIDYVPIEAKQSRARKEGGDIFTAHSVKFVHKSLLDPEEFQKRNEFAQLVWSNSHDRSSIAKFSAGILVKACGNGLIRDQGESEQFSFRHLGGYSVRQKIREVAYTVSAQAQDALNAANDWKNIDLPLAAQLQFASQAVELKPSLTAGKLLEARRVEDYATEDGRRDLWTAFNVIQENVIRGGIPYTSASGRNVRTRPIQSVLNDLSLNSRLWRIAQSFAQAA
jgi:hypothetical protein